MLNRLLCTLMLFGCGAKQEPNAVVAGPIVYSDVAISGVSDAALQTLLHEQWESLMQAYRFGQASWGTTGLMVNCLRFHHWTSRHATTQRSVCISGLNRYKAIPSMKTMH